MTPLLTGEVVPEGIDLQYDVDHGLGPVTNDPSCAGGEASLGRLMIDTSRGHRHFVGLPVFPMVAFRHRCFLVKRGTTISDLAALEGKRVGLDGWPNSGNTWTKVTLRQAGVDIWKITWVIAPIEGAADAEHGHVPPEAPPNVEGGPAGKSLVDLLLAGEIDVLVAAFMPTGFFSPASQIVPMLPDYRAAEKAYYQQHGYVPAHHLIKLHREVVERDPWIVTSLMTAFTASKRLWLARRRHLVDTTPWLLAELAALNF
jgi:4,5-dihydroxyphthalate decarboxylase